MNNNSPNKNSSDSDENKSDDQIATKFIPVKHPSTSHSDDSSPELKPNKAVPKPITSSSSSSEDDAKAKKKANSTNLQSMVPKVITLNNDQKLKVQPQNENRKKTLDSSDSEDSDDHVRPKPRPNMEVTSDDESEKEDKIKTVLTTFKQEAVNNENKTIPLDKQIIPAKKDILPSKPIIPSKPIAKNQIEGDGGFKGKTLDVKNDREKLNEILISSDEESDDDKNKILKTKKENNVGIQNQKKCPEKDDKDTMLINLKKKVNPNTQEKMKASPNTNDESDKESEKNSNKNKFPPAQPHLSQTERIDKFKNQSQKDSDELIKLSNQKKPNNEIDSKSNKDAKKNNKMLMTIESKNEDQYASDSDDNKPTYKMNVQKKEPSKISTNDDNSEKQQQMKKELKKESNRKPIKTKNNDKREVIDEEKEETFDQTIENPDKMICFKTELKLPSKIKKILSDDRIGGESWTYYKSLKKHLNKLYYKFEEPVSDVGKFKEFITINEYKFAKKSKEVKKLSTNFVLYRDVKKVNI